MNNAKKQDLERKKQEYLDYSLVEAVKYSSIPKVDTLLQRGANIHTRSQFIDTDFASYQPIHIAASDANLPMLKYLVSKGADIKATAPVAGYPDEKTPLEIARIEFSHRKWKKYEDVISFLETEEAKLNVKEAKNCGHHPLSPYQPKLKENEGRES